MELVSTLKVCRITFHFPNSNGIITLFNKYILLMYKNAFLDIYDLLLTLTFDHFLLLRTILNTSTL